MLLENAVHVESTAFHHTISEYNFNGATVAIRFYFVCKVTTFGCAKIIYTTHYYTATH